MRWSDGAGARADLRIRCYHATESGFLTTWPNEATWPNEVANSLLQAYIQGYPTML